MTSWNPQHYFENGEQRQVSKQVLDAALKTASIIRSRNKNVPVIFTLGHLAALTGVPYDFLRAVITRDNFDPYKVFALRKRNAGFPTDRFRFICSPHPKLLRVQRWINQRILNHIPIDNASYAYREKTSILDAAIQHCGCNWLIKLDLSNFFGSILEPKIYRVFRELGYGRLLSLELARLCTRIRHYGNPRMPKKKKLLKKFPYRKSKFIGHIPQGAATSPLLANIVSRELDASLNEVSTKYNITYTRYADDLIFSSKSEFDRAKASQIIKDLYYVIKSHGHWPNFTKTKISPPGARKIVLGLLVDGRAPRLTKEFKSEIMTHIHFITRPDIGLTKHMSNRGFDSAEGLKNFLYGKLSFAAHVEPLWTAKIRSKLDKVKWPT